MKILAILFSILLLSSTALMQENDMPEAGESRTDEHGIEQVWVPAGCFMMGSSEAQIEAVMAQNPNRFVVRELPSEQPQHEVCLTAGYWIDTYEVTNAAFQAFVDDGGYTTEDLWSEDGWAWLQDQKIDDLPLNCVEEMVTDQPRVCVTWYEAEAYANWRGGSLPTEAQWEFAARGPDSSVYPWGDEWDAEHANIVDSEGLTSVGTYPDGVSWVGAHDLSGNAMEWTRDWLDTEYYAEGVKDDPTGPETGTIKVERGGWWGSNEFVGRGAYRHYEDPPTYNDHHIGFRVVTAEIEG